MKVEYVYVLFLLLQLYVTEAIVREVRDSNLQLKDENDRLRRSEYIVNTNMIQLMADVKILLEKVNLIG